LQGLDLRIQTLGRRPHPSEISKLRSSLTKTGTALRELRRDPRARALLPPIEDRQSRLVSLMQYTRAVGGAGRGATRTSVELEMPFLPSIAAMLTVEGDGKIGRLLAEAERRVRRPSTLTAEQMAV